MSTHETDVTSTTSDEVVRTKEIETKSTKDQSTVSHNASFGRLSVDDNQTAPVVTVSTPIKRQNVIDFVHTLEDFEMDNPTYDAGVEYGDTEKVQTRKRKRTMKGKQRGRRPKQLKVANLISGGTSSHENTLSFPARNKVKLSASVPSRHLRITKRALP